jgi:signal transduction histidine kinase
LIGTDAPFHLNGHRRHSAEFSIDRRTVQLSVSRTTNEDSVGEKILILTDVTDRKLAEYALLTTEKLAATGKLANSIAHEINNPLEALTNLIYLARHNSSIDEIQQHLSRADAELSRIARITKQSLAFHRDTQSPVPVDIGDLISNIVGLFETVAAAHRVKLLYRQQRTPEIHAFPGQLSQVFGNILQNAVEAAPPQSEVAIRVRAIHRREREGLRVTIHDRGRGIPKEIQRNMFDPFFTTKALKGSGLGLWVSKALVVRHGGTIRFRSSVRSGKSGTTFEVFLPLGVLNGSESLH